MLLSEDMTEWSVSIKKYVRNISVSKSVHTDVRKSVQKDRNSGSGRFIHKTLFRTKWCGVQWKKQAAAMQRSSAAIQAAKTHWKISWKLPVQQ